MTSEAIVIGVNQYQNLQPLEYAQQDAKAVAAFLKTEAKFDHVYYFAEDAEPINGVSMQPTQNNLRRILETRVAKRGLGDGDNFWFFFSGHGMRDGERDFLMPIDGYSENVALSGISTAQVSEWLRGCGADNVVMILDACRNGGRKDGKGIGDETREDCRQTGVISLFSCSPNQFSYELPQYQQGAFTKVLLEGLGVQGACATVARLDEYLKRRVPEVVRECLGNTVNQFPYSIAEPINKSHLILMPQHSRPEDLNALKMDAFRAQFSGDLRLALQCWLRVNVASSGLDADFHDAVFDLRLKLRESTIQPPKSKSQTTSEVPLTKGDLGGSDTETESTESDSKCNDINYEKLRSLLEGKNWEAANKETLHILLCLANRRSEGWLLVGNIRNFSQDDLDTLNTLWSNASQGRFGFGIQARIFEKNVEPFEYLGQGEFSKSEAWQKFDAIVKWRSDMGNHYEFNLNAPEGHLPHWRSLVSGWNVRDRGISFLKRGLDCPIGSFQPIKPEDIVIDPIDGELTKDKYAKLQKLLGEQKWLEADEETYNVMVTVIGNSNFGSGAKKYPQDSIEIIDRLWAKESSEKFGFIVQARIWQQVNQDRSEFDIQVGWKLPTATRQISRSQLKLSLEEAPIGHFPAFFKSWGGGGWSVTQHLLDRISEFLDSDNIIEKNESIEKIHIRLKENLQFEKTEKYLTNDANIAVRINTFVEIRFDNFKKVESHLKLSVDVRQEIQETIDQTVSECLSKVDAERYYVRFYLANYRDKESVEELLENSIRMKIQESYGAIVNIVTLRPVSTEITELFRQLRGEVSQFEFSIDSLTDGEGVEFQGQFQIDGISEGGLSTFDSRMVTMLVAQEPQQRRISGIKVLKESIVGSINQMLTASDCAALTYTYTDPSNLLELQNAINKCLPKNIREQYGLEISVRNLRRTSIHS